MCFLPPVMLEQQEQQETLELPFSWVGSFFYRGQNPYQCEKIIKCVQISYRGTSSAIGPSSVSRVMESFRSWVLAYAPPPGAEGCPSYGSTLHHLG